MQKPKIWPHITLNNPTPVQKLVTIHPGVSFPRMRQIAHQKVLGCFFFLGGGILATRYSQAPGRILTQNTPKHAVLQKDVPFRGREHKI